MKRLLSKIKEHFRKPELEFNKPLTSADVVRMFKMKQFNGLKKLMPQFNWGGKRLSRSKSALVVLGFIVGIGLFSLTGNPLPLLISVLSVSYGTKKAFNLVDTEYISVTTLDSTHVFIAYRDDGGDDYGCGIVASLSGTTITYGAENVFNSGLTHNISVAALDSTHVFIAYKDGGNSGYGTGIVALISGTTISSYGSANVFHEVSIAYPAVTALDSTHVFIAYGGVGSEGTGIVGVISGTTISSYGSLVLFNAAYSPYISVATIDSTHVFIVYQDNTNSQYGTGIIGLISSGTTITYGAENVFSEGTQLESSIALLDSTHVFIAYRDASNHRYGTGVVAVFSGTTISSYGAKKVWSGTTALISTLDVTTLDSTHAFIAYRVSHGEGIVATISGTTISYGTAVDFNDVYITYPSVCTLDSTHVFIGYDDKGSADDYGEGVVGIYTPPVVGPANLKSFNGVASADIKSINGVAIASVKSVNGVE